ncbi:glycosyltransferase family 2 protein [uncultured Trichococcus sp.]|uniref:glycosyltransferase family 2 protein n=1 Tax=uncultured Trichococcus sp. TaxID=189665 RepID=UPI0029C767AA|nr:glycosyltransferase family 2 protein [uncultured Trichococcus sp.]
MENKPFFSIVIPAYNCAGSIRATLESIAAQTVSDFEVIIVNDGSKDATADALQAFTAVDSRFAFITIPNNGPGNARNQGIARAQGRYLFLMDADDEIERHTLERYQTILNNEAPDLIVASYNLRVLDNQEIVSEKQVIAEDHVYASNAAFLDNLYPLMNKQLMYVIWNKIYRLDIIREHQIAFPSYSSCEDRLFNIAYYRHAQKVVTTSEVLYQYAFEGKSSLTNKYFDNKFETFLEFYNELLDLTDKDLGGFSALFLKGTMSCIIPLHGKSCPLDWAGKKAYIQKILEHPRVQYATANSLTDTPIRKIMKLLFQSKSIYLNYIASGMMHLLSNASPKLIEKLKGNF